MKNIIPIIAIALLYSIPGYADVVVIVNPSNDADLNKKTVKKIFLGESKKFPSGQPATPVNLVEGENARGEFNENYLGKSQSQLNSYWARLEFSGKALPPEEKSVSEVIDLVKNNPEMIGYVDATEVTDGVRVVK